MAIWIVKATWLEDEAEVSEQWEVNTETACDAVQEATAHIRFHPHHVEAKLRTGGAVCDLSPGQVRRLPRA
jgi:hypothetical protein